MYDFNLGHGFLPRVDQRNHAAVERCLGAADGDLFDHTALDLPWLVIEGPWADRRPALLDHCQSAGVPVIVDTQAWRYREWKTFEVDKFRNTVYAPGVPLSEDDPVQLREYVRRDLAAQAAAGADAYLLPGFVPRRRDDDIRKATLETIETARTAHDLEAHPQIAFIGAHAQALDAAYALIDDLPLHLAGLYIQVTPVDPMRDSPAKLASIARLLLHAKARGFLVIGGRLGAMGLVLRALGVDATDAGLGDGEKFRLGEKLRNSIPKPKTDDEENRMPGGRLYVRQARLSVSKQEWLFAVEIEHLRGHLLCPLTCCRFKVAETAPSRGREHSLRTRLAEAAEQAALPATMRLDHAIRQLEEARSFLTMVNAALREAGRPPWRTTLVENLIAMCELLADPGLAAA